MVWKTTALLLNSAAVGASLFAAGDICVFVQLNKKPGTHESVPTLVREWWPKGAVLMFPLVTGAAVANALAYRATSNSDWLLGSLCHGAVVLFTMTVMRPAIADLRSETPKDFDDTLLTFRWMHNVRVAAVLAALGVTGWAVCPRYHPGVRP